MKIALTGATGRLGAPLAQALQAAGHRVTTLGRRATPGLDHLPWDLGGRPDLAGQEALIHLALAHLPGRYRGGEGQDPEGFRAANLGGSLALFEAARSAGLRVIFLSTRAVYGDYPPGTRLTEDLPPRPDTLYGAVKAEAEEALAPGDVALRVTGVYGARPNKWAELFADFRAGRPIAPRVATEVWVEDLAAALLLILKTPDAPPILNVSDLVLDRQYLLRAYARLAEVKAPLPERADAATVSAMDCTRLCALGWRPSGQDGLDQVLRQIVADEARPSR